MAKFAPSLKLIGMLRLINALVDVVAVVAPCEATPMTEHVGTAMTLLLVTVTKVGLPVTTVVTVEGTWLLLIT